MTWIAPPGLLSVSKRPILWIQGWMACKKNIGMLSRCVGMGSGKQRQRWNWTWQGMWKTTSMDRVTVLGKESARRVYHLWKIRREKWQQQKWRRLRYSTSSLPASHCLSGFPHLSSPWTSVQELGEQSPSHCKQSASLRPTNETKCVQTYRTQSH